MVMQSVQLMARHLAHLSGEMMASKKAMQRALLMAKSLECPLAESMAMQTA